MRKSLFLFIVLLGSAISLYARDLRGDTIDVHSYMLKLDLSDFTNKVLHGDALIGIKAKQNGVEGVRLDLLALNVDSVKVNTFTAPFTYNDSVVDINLLTTLSTGDSATLEIFYHGQPLHVTGDFGGFYWNGLYAFNIGVSFLADPHVYGRVWFPCFDNFEQRSYYEYYITTKNTQKAFCNGLLQGVVASGANNIWHWKLNENIPSYLASVSVSDYATLSDTLHAINGTIPIELAARPADTAALSALFIHLHNAFHIQEHLWGPYRWERVGYCIVPFNAGAMEHATNISFMQYYLSVLATDCETTMAHELSHHWFGDLVTCDSANEMWLNEGWATYNERVFLENMYSRAMYDSMVLDNHDYVLHLAHVNDKSYLPLGNVPSAQTYGTTVYHKGADVIHTLRWYMGDSLFFSCVRTYLNHYAGKNGSNIALRDELTQCSGINLTDFFNDWVLSPGFPHFSIEDLYMHTGPGGAGNFFVFNIRQRLNHAPHYYNHVPIKVTYFDASMNRIAENTIDVSGECTHWETVLPTYPKPVYAALDFDRNIEDAISDEWKVIVDTGSYDFGVARMKLHVTNSNDSSLVRVLHNWVAPDAMRQPIQGLHLHDYRFWTVEGIFDSTFNSDATVLYDGSSGAYLDSTFFTNNEDSLVMLYRATTYDDWSFADSFTVNKGNSITDKKGSITIYNLKKGEYSMAIWNSALAAATNTHTDCSIQVGIKEPEKPSFSIFPNPANNTLTLTFATGVFNQAYLFDLSGRLLIQQKISTSQNTDTLNIGSIPGGSYIIEMKSAAGSSTGKIFVKK